MHKYLLNSISLKQPPQQTLCKTKTQVSFQITVQRNPFTLQHRSHKGKLNSRAKPQSSKRLVFSFFHLISIGWSPSDYSVNTRRARICAPCRVGCTSFTYLPIRSYFIKNSLKFFALPYIDVR